MSRRGDVSRNWLLLAGVAVVSLIVGYLIGASGREEPPEAGVAGPASTPPAPPPAAVEPEGPAAELTPVEGVDSARPITPPAEPRPIPPGEGRQIALVIDDLGRRVEDVADLADLGVPLSFGVLPFESRTSEVIDELGRRDVEVLLHLPMEPTNGADPGPGALTSNMSSAELVAATRWALSAVDGASGVNNHMGSELSTDSESMRAVLSVLAERDLFFLDSRTSPDSVGYRLALEMGLFAAERQVFLDAESGPDAVRDQFRRLLEVAHDRGSAVAIGHPHADTIAILRQEIPQAIAAGFEFVPVGRLTRRVR